ncbi:MAG TPA: hypothetical protein VFD89_00255, partial [Clostridia bacterium]|nr:hypothetical protein [Clostridia bacterium]
IAVGTIRLQRGGKFLPAARFDYFYNLILDIGNNFVNYGIIHPYNLEEFDNVLNKKISMACDTLRGYPA